MELILLLVLMSLSAAMGALVQRARMIRLLERAAQARRIRDQAIAYDLVRELRGPLQR